MQQRKKKLTSIGIAVIITLAIIGMVGALNGWFGRSGAGFASVLLPNWQYRKPVTISGQTSNLTDYQVLVTLDTASLISAGKMQSNCDDIRFTDADDNQVLNYWLESGCNTASTKIWVKAPSLAANKSATIYVYYGNASAGSAENGDDTFELFDNFLGDTLDTGKWEGTTGNASVSGGIMTYTAAGDEWINSIANFAPDKAVRTRNKMPYSGDAVLWGFQIDPYSSPYQMVNMMLQQNTGKNEVMLRDTGLVEVSTNWDETNIYTTKEIIWNDSGDSVSWFENDVEKTNSPHTTEIPDESLACMPARAAVNTMYVDWILIRKYVSPEPTVSVGAEETQMIPVAHWRFEENSGTTAYDSTPNDNDGTLGDGTCTPGSGTCPTWTTGKFGSALDFDGTDDRIAVANHASLNPTNITVEAWIKWTNHGAGNPVIVSKHGDLGDYNWMLYTDVAANKIRLGISTNGTNWYPFNCGTIIDTTSFYHVVLWYDGETLKGYVNGVEDGSDATPSGDLAGNTNPLYIGFETVAEHFEGIIDDVRIYNYARTPEEIRLDYNAGLAVKLGGSPDSIFKSNLLPLWKYRKPVTISGHTSNLTDYQVSITTDTASLITAGKMQADCDDIRFTDADDNQVLNYWLESGCNTTTTKIWVKVPSLAANKSATIYVYYGNADAGLAENGDNTFILFDNFLGSSLDTTKWEGDTGSASVSGGILTFTGVGFKYINSITDFAPDKAVRTRNKMAYSGGANQFGFLAGTGGKGVYGYLEQSVGRNWTYVRDAATISVVTNWDETNIYTTKEIIWNDSGDSASWFEDGVEKTNSPYTTGANIPGESIPCEVAGCEGQTMYVDWIFVRKYVSPEPTASVGSEETQTTPVAHWRFEENSGTTAYDSTPNDNDGTLGDGTCTPGSGTCPTWTTGKFGSALNFDGGDDKVVVADDASLRVSNLTAEAWIKWTDYGAGNPVIVTKHGSAGNYGWALAMLAADKKIRPGVSISGNDWFAFSSTSTLDLDTFYHVCMTYDGSTTKIYIDGILDNSDNSPSGNIYQSTADLELGKQVNMEYFEGIIDDVRIYNYARTPEEIRLDYNAGLAVKLGGSPDSIFKSNLLYQWKYRKKITIDSSKIDEDLTNLPVLVKLTSSNFDFSKARSDGYDIRFTDADDNTLLKYERERHDSGNSLAEYWVKIPNIPSAGDLSFYIYYGNSSAVDGADPTNVWDSNFKMVLHLNETSGDAIDSTVNSTDGTYQGSLPTQVDGQIGKGQDFNRGTSDYISTPTIGLGNIFTISAWVKVNNFDDHHNIMGKKGHLYSMIYTDGSLFMEVGDGTDWGNSCFSSLGEVVVGNFYHLTFHYDGTTTTIYKNGISVGDNSNTISIPATWYSIGQYYYDAGTQLYFVDGIIDEVRISSIARNVAWIKASYNSGNNSLVSYGSEETQTTPVAHWRFEENSGTTAYDSTPNDNDGTLGDGTCTPGSGTCPTWTTGKFGSALDFDGGDDYVDISDVPSLSFDRTDPFTIELWIKKPSAVSDSYFSKMHRNLPTAGAHRGYDIHPQWNRADAANKLTAVFQFINSWPSNALQVAAPGIDLADGAWHHLAVTHTGTGTAAGFAIFIDGVSQTLTADYDSLTATTVTTASVNIGRRASAEDYCDGIIDEVRIYNYVRTPSQILVDYNAGLATHFK